MTHPFFDILYRNRCTAGGWTRATTQRVAASMANVCEPPEYSTRDGPGTPYYQAPINDGALYWSSGSIGSSLTMTRGAA